MSFTIFAGCSRGPDKQGNEDPNPAVAAQPENAENPAPEDHDPLAEHAERLSARNRLQREIDQLVSKKNWGEAAKASSKQLAIERHIYKEQPQELDAAIQRTASILERAQDFAGAEPLRRELLESTLSNYSKDDHRTVDARLKHEFCKTWSTLSADDQKQVLKSMDLVAAAKASYRVGNHQDAMAASKDAARIRRDVLGESHVEYADALNTLASSFFATGALVEAGRVFQKAAQIREQVLGNNHPVTRATFDNLAEVLLAHADELAATDQPEAAVQEIDKLLELRTKQFGDETHWRVVDARLERKRHQLSSEITDEQRQKLVEASQAAADVHSLFAEEKYEEAIKAARRAIDLQRAVLGEHNTQIADSLVNLAVLQGRTQQSDEASQNIADALDIYKEVLGDLHPARADFLVEVAGPIRRSGKVDQAQELLSEAIRLYQQTLGQEAAETSAAHDKLVELLQVQARDAEAAGEVEIAIKHTSELQNVELARFGQNHWRTKDAGIALSYLKQLSELEEPKRKQLAEAAKLMTQAIAQHQMGVMDQAALLARQSHDIYLEVLGSEAPKTLEAANNLAAALTQLGEFSEAEQLLRQTVSHRRKLLGDHHPRFATTLNNLAELYRLAGEYEQAQPLYEESLEISRQYREESPSDFSTALNNLALLFHATGQYDQAKPLYRQALQISERQAANRPADYAQSLNNLAGLFRDVGDLASAEAMYRRAVLVQRKIHGEDHPQFAASLNNLAALHHAAKDFEKAEPLYQKAIDVYQQQQTPASLDYANCASNLASLYHEVGQYEKSGELYREAVKIRESILGELHPTYAASLANLAAHYRAMGRFEEAEPLYENSLSIVKESLGAEHPQFARILRNLARLYESQGDTEQAIPHLRESLRIAKLKLQQTSAVQSEREQLAMAKMFRDTLDVWLSLTSRAELPSAEAYAHALSWKGAVFARQRRQRDFQRLLRATDDPTVQQQIRELDSISCRIASLALSVPSSKQQRLRWQQLGDLTQRKETLESELARHSQEFRRQQEAAEVAPDKLQQQLPAGVVLVDLIEYDHAIPPPEGKGKWNSERRLAAFMISSDREITRQELGAAGPINQAVALWRGTINRKNPIVGDDDPAVVLKKLVWQPIERIISDADVVLISPDGALARMPLAALPGGKPNTYLIEERSIATIAVPQLLPELLREQSQSSQDEDFAMLLVGDVDFDAELDEGGNGSSDSSPQMLFNGWKPLPETRTELVTVGDSFELAFPDGDLTKLRRFRATESAFRGAVPGSRWVHLATHGFFAPPERHSALAGDPSTRSQSLSREAEALAGGGIEGFHPGVLSGLVFAGANHFHPDGRNNGILTALEVAEMDFSSTEVVVLSACETGLGEVAGGEGVLGLQRAFQLAGAKTVIASFWTVDDVATQQLMVNFYDQLWSGKSKQSKLDAFRAAQLKLLREGPKRGFESEDEPDKPDQKPRTPPAYWASFSISGDWR